MIVVTTPAASRRLTTVARVKAELRITDSLSDDAIGLAIDEASAAITSAVGRVLVRETVTETIETTGDVRLSRFPVVSIENVTLNGAEVPADGYELDRVGILYRFNFGRRIFWASGRMVVRYVAGYAAADATDPHPLPRDLERAAIITAGRFFEDRGRNTSIRSESVDGVGAMSFLDPRGEDGGLPPGVRHLVMPHRAVHL
jgi:uncharacterized phiE125 gp8 family phage protein